MQSRYGWRSFEKFTNSKLISILKFGNVNCWFIEYFGGSSCRKVTRKMRTYKKKIFADCWFGSWTSDHSEEKHFIAQRRKEHFDFQLDLEEKKKLHRLRRRSASKHFCFISGAPCAHSNSDLRLPNSTGGRLHWEPQTQPSRFPLRQVQNQKQKAGQLRQPTSACCCSLNHTLYRFRTLQRECRISKYIPTGTVLTVRI
jgi:hypothetical protein